MADNDVALWVGICAGCQEEYRFDDAMLRELYPEHLDDINAGAIVATCICNNWVHLDLLPSVQVVPFSHWNVVPPAEGCPLCGQDHPDELPHDATSLTYQYWFRNNEATNGRPERWPTWIDAMAHCHPNVQETWTGVLVTMGINPQGDRPEGAAPPAAEA